MNKEKPFSYKVQEIINEYNKKRSKEITEEHLNNIKKLREYFKAFLPLCTIFKFYHINAEKSLSTDFSPHF
ncbi:hypothetical protein [Spiroplasma ixodetis]|uniref:hypothetical protein n=1 Tax=Spiroplasma ixodetis TaxID=2141 RepID=UPI002576474D|nr:hypothetical protein [Spiroplasma ixodetis]WJG70895.1 hypothetical protein SIXOD_v1c21830 [Spiroplasma ixodetis Y32]